VAHLKAALRARLLHDAQHHNSAKDDAPHAMLGDAELDAQMTVRAGARGLARLRREALAGERTQRWGAQERRPQDELSTRPPVDRCAQQAQACLAPGAVR
jgi:hypothetical protein